MSFIAASAKRLYQRNKNLQLFSWLDRQHFSESGTIMFTALIVGIGAGLGAVVFRLLINGVQILSYQQLGSLLDGIKPFHLLIIPALGGAIVGPLVYFFAREAKGHGVPEVMEAVALKGGRIRPRVAIVKSLASAVCIGTGGSVGREGPIVQIGSALGSTIGQWLKLSDERVRSLVACGAAGGIAATFNAPIAGAIFALEVILGQFHATYFGAVVISAVTADVVAHLFEPNLRAFAIPEYALVHPVELIFYIILGAIAAVLSFGFARLLYLSEDIWDKIPFPEYLKPILGGIALGVIGILTYKLDGFPRVFGVGYDSITEALFGNLTLQVTLALLFIKLLATITTLGSGGSGGVFAPSLFMGAMMGAAFGHVVNYFFPSVTAPVGAYALVGMSAFFTGAAHAPITAIIILFELTGDYRIILPLMLATVVSTFVSRIISRESIYTLKLTRRGVHLEHGKDIDLMQSVTVAEIMTTDVDTVPIDMPLNELAEAFAQTHHHGFPVINSAGDLVGVVSLQDLKRVILSKSIEDKTVADIATTTGLLIAYPHEDMGEALRRLARRDVGRLPVVAGENSQKLVGAIRRRDVIRAYNHAILKRAHHQHRIETLRLRKLDEAGFFHIDIPASAAVIGTTLTAIQLPEECLIVSIRRANTFRVAHGNTRLEANDKLTVFAGHKCIGEVRAILTREPEAEATEN
ncbi:MAG: chloride channel protein [Anaerolineae bacterium]|nr:chloride channel protein [Anaerolineae bacterium]